MSATAPASPPCSSFFVERHGKKLYSSSNDSISHLCGYFLCKCIEAWFRKLNDLAGRNIDEMVVGRGDLVSRFSRSEMLLGNDSCRDQMAQISVDCRQGHAPPSRPQALV